MDGRTTNQPQEKGITLSTGSTTGKSLAEEAAELDQEFTSEALANILVGTLRSERSLSHGTN